MNFVFIASHRIAYDVRVSSKTVNAPVVVANLMAVWRGIIHSIKWTDNTGEDQEPQHLPQ